LLADSHKILKVSDVRQMEIHTAEPSLLDISPFGVKIAIEMLKKYKSPDKDQNLLN
jgi:hypothetical protein